LRFFLIGLVAAALAMVDKSMHLGLPIALVYHPVFWFIYVAVVTLTAMVRFVRQQSVLVVERLGRYNRTLSAGINPCGPSSNASLMRSICASR
jgi:hypothetical protein